MNTLRALLLAVAGRALAGCAAFYLILWLEGLK
jgi:hypothetical protein